MSTVLVENADDDRYNARIIEWCSKDGDSPLHWASRNGHFEVVKPRLSSGADINCTCNNCGWKSLHMASCEGYFCTTSR